MASTALLRSEADWAGCGGELRPIRRIDITSRGPGQPNEVTWIDALVNGCTPSTCQGGCDRDLSGILIDGFVFRFAACQFGQKTAGSPLGYLVRALARFFAQLMDQIHVADLIFIMATPEHGQCAGFEGGCAVCEEQYGHALKLQAMWQEKARALMLLSANGPPGRPARGVHWVGYQLVQRAFYMLQDKVASMVTTRDDLAAASLSTPRIIAPVRGKALLRLPYSLRCSGGPVPLAADAQPEDRHRARWWCRRWTKRRRRTSTGIGSCGSPRARGRPWSSCAWQWRRWQRWPTPPAGGTELALWCVSGRRGAGRSHSRHHVRRQRALLGGSTAHFSG
jgi:hypothetical protein